MTIGIIIELPIVLGEYVNPLDNPNFVSYNTGAKLPDTIAEAVKV